MSHISHNDASAGALIPRATIESIVSQRDATLKAYGVAHVALMAATEACGEANAMLAKTVRRKADSYTHHLHNEKAAFLSAFKVPNLETYLKNARRIVDTEVWSHIIELTDLQRLMDKRAKDELRQQLMTEPPEVTVDNVYATLQTFIADSGTIWKRGIAECFSKLDRRFKSHDGWEIGSRVILTRMYDENGWKCYGRNHEDTLVDIERVFRIIDDNPAGYCEIVLLIDRARGGAHGARQTEVESQYFTLRIFKNGNAHLWFKRDDLLVKVNQLLGEYYGAPIPEERDADPTESDLFNAKMTPAKNYGFFPTPDAAADRVIDLVRWHRQEGAPQLRVLEPSAGTGNLAGRCVEKGAVVDCVEIQPELAATLAQCGLYQTVYRADFLSLDPATTGLYDRVVMNPPFDRERDIDHVLHAMKFLKPGGQLVSIMSAGTEFRMTKKSVAFRELVEKMPPDRWDRRVFTDLPERSFSEVGTNCNTIILNITKPL